MIYIEFNCEHIHLLDGYLKICNGNHIWNQIPFSMHENIKNNLILIVSPNVN